jgi:hypothetical protein
MTKTPTPPDWKAVAIEAAEAFIHFQFVKSSMIDFTASAEIYEKAISDYRKAYDRMHNITTTIMCLKDINNE